MLKKTLLGCALSLAPLITNAQTTLTAETTTPGSTPHYIDSTLAAVLASAGVATMQITEGATLTNSVQAVAEGRLDMAPAPLILPFLMSRGIGPYSGIGPDKGAELAANIRVIFFNAGSAQILGYYNSNPIEDIRDLSGKRIWNGPPRGAALTSGRAMIQLCLASRMERAMKVFRAHGRIRFQQSPVAVSTLGPFPRACPLVARLQSRPRAASQSMMSRLIFWRASLDNRS